MNYQKLSGLLSLLLLMLVSLSAMSRAKDNTSGMVKVQMVTDHGTIKLVLYNETPLHRDNFIKLVKEGYFDSLLFHRCIQNFMIQGGDPDSKHAERGVELGNGGPPYTIPAEFNNNLFHKKGVLAAARESDLDNPTQASSGSQFYIVQGRVYTDSLLTVQAKRITKAKLFNKVINRFENKMLLEQYKAFSKADKVDSVKYVSDQINKQVEAELPNERQYEFTDQERLAYTSIGGTPHLDGSYTVFGEVYEGLEVVALIAAEKVDKVARPLKDVRILKVSIIP